MKTVGNNLIFETTGRQEYCFSGVIGVGVDDDNTLHITYGLDGMFSFEHNGGLTDEERNELADYMIALWQRYRDRGC